MSHFEVKTPDGRFVRLAADNIEQLRAGLVKGYEIVGEVLGADGEGKGGFVDPVGVGAKSVMMTLLDRHGDELLAWLQRNGIHEYQRNLRLRDEPRIPKRNEPPVTIPRRLVPDAR